MRRLAAGDAMMRLARLAFASLSIVTGVSTSAKGEPSLFPLEQGWSWEYVGEWGAAVVARTAGFREVQGVTCVVRDVVHQYPNDFDHYENYWTADGDDVFLHGFTTFTGGFSVSHHPPILWIDAPLEVGKTWSTTTQCYLDLEGTVPCDGGPFTYTLGCRSAGDISVPAGSYFAYEIGQPLLRFGEEHPVDVTGRRLIRVLSWNATADRLELSRTTTTDWLAAGPGLVRTYGMYFETLDLLRYGSTVAVTPESWGRTKVLYRDR